MFKTPDVFQYQDACAFFTDFFAMNQPEMSHRGFAEKIDWPPSLLGDIMQRRRGLSIARALEFAKFYGMNGVESERLVMLSLNDSDSGTVRAFVNDYFDRSGKQWTDPTPERSPSETAVHPLPPEVMSDHTVGSLLLFLIWCDGKTNAEEICRSLYLSPELADPEVLHRSLEILKVHNLIEGDLPDVRVVHADLGTFGMDKTQYFKTIEPLRQVVDLKQRLSHWRVSRLIFPRALYPEFHQRINSLVNWMQNSCAEPRPGQREDYVLLQTNFLVSHLLDLQKLGLAINADKNFGHSIESLPEGTSPLQV